jgi:hypothetical protein
MGDHDGMVFKLGIETEGDSHQMRCRHSCPKEHFGQFSRYNQTGCKVPVRHDARVTPESKRGTTFCFPPKNSTRG